jgi:putative membrane protein
MPVDHGDSQDMERLHPFTLLHRLIVSLPALIVILMPVFRGPDTNTWIMVIIVAVYGLSILPLILLQYLRFRYAVTPEEIVIHSGVFTYKHRNIPIERIQNIEVEQSLIPRLLGLAKIEIETAGSRSTEGVIEFVSLERARAIRESIRAYQTERREASQQIPVDENRIAGREQAHDLNPAEGAAAAEDSAIVKGPRDEPHPAEPNGTSAHLRSPSAEVLHTMDLGRVLLSGAFRFSLLYIAMIFTATEYLGLEPNEMARWITGNRLEAFTETLRTSPVLIVLSTVLVVGILAWITGILMNLSRFYGFRIEYGEEKLHTRHGLLTVSEGTIPLKKIQALIIRTNPMMRAFGWYRLELQTMGFDPNDRGYRIAAPFAQMAEILKIAHVVRPITPPEEFRNVSRLMIRRTFIRYTLGLLIVTSVSAYFWEWAPWLLIALPFLYVLAYQQYLNHGFEVKESHLFVRRGVFRRYTWILPLERFQVFYLTQTLFQRRLGLQSLYVDTPGSGATAQPVIVDLPEEEARHRFVSLYEEFQLQFASHVPAGDDLESREDFT